MDALPKERDFDRVAYGVMILSSFVLFGASCFVLGMKVVFNGTIWPEGIAQYIFFICAVFIPIGMVLYATWQMTRKFN